jgi:hypothetical protein
MVCQGVVMLPARDPLAGPLLDSDFDEWGAFT